MYCPLLLLILFIKDIIGVGSKPYRNKQSRWKNHINKKTIPITDILYIYQDSNYQFIRYESEGKVHEEKERRSMKKLVSIMTPYPQFKSCHESYLVNTDKIEIVSAINGKKKLKLEGIDTPLNISNQYRNDFNQFLQNKK